MYDYDAQYRHLRAAGLPAWQGADFARGLARLTATLDDLVQNGTLPRPPARVVEIGCGNGIIAMLLAGKGYEVHGIDISQAAVDWARERFAEASRAGTFRQGDVCDMSIFADASFDAVMDGQCLHCLMGDDRGRCLQEVRRILSPNGVFVVSSMCGPPKSDEAKASFDAASLSLMKNGEAFRTLKPLNELCSELVNAGFGVVDAKVSVNAWWDHVTIVCHVASLKF
jgi:ubiquinone/menaquinone biosynthesis C-methylase UbiE